MENYTFDLQRILFGNFPLLYILEIALRTAIMFLYLLLALRLIGPRSLAQLSLFEFALIIALGSAVGDPMFYPEIPILHGLVVITVVVILQRLLMWVTEHNHTFENLLEGSPTNLVIDGRFDLKGLKDSSLSYNEILMQLRLKEVEHLGQVKRAFLELNGSVSVFKFEDDQVRSGLPLFPALEIDEMDSCAANTPAPITGPFACVYCGEVVQMEKGSALPICPRCKHSTWVEARQP